MNSKDWRNNYCIKCTKRSHDLVKGIICSLTNDSPIVDKNCPDYHIDSEKENEIIEKAKNEILNKSYLAIPTSEFIQTARIYDPIKYQYFNSKFAFGSLVLLGTLFTALINTSIFFFTETNIFESVTGIILYLLMNILGLSIVVIGMLKSKNRSIQLEFKPEGICTKSEIIAWNKIMFSAVGGGIETKSNVCLIVFCNPLEKYEIDLDPLDGTTEQVVFSFEKMKKEHNSE